MKVKDDRSERAKKVSSQRGEVPDRRLIVGLLCERLIEEWTAGLWGGARDAALGHGANMLCFSGGTLRDPRVFVSQANVIYDLAATQKLDGLVIWGAQLAYHVTLEELQAFCERYRPLPIVNIGLEWEGVPSLLVDNYQGMHDVVAHLIEVHGYRRIVYIDGPGDTPEMRDRRRGYTDALAEHGIALDPTLVVTESDMNELYRQNVDSGEIGVHVLLDGRKLRPGVDFEAIVGRNDGTCWFALKALQARGIRVPTDVAMASFDDLQESRYQMPPLTAARQPFYDLGWRGVEMLLARLRGEEVPDRVVLPMEVIVRRSCGCADPMVAAVSEPSGRIASRKIAGRKKLSLLSRERKKVIAEMAREVGESEEARRWAGQVLDGFVAEASGEMPGRFLQTLDEVLYQVMTRDGGLAPELAETVAAWHGALSVLYRRLRPRFSGDVAARVENLWQQARVLVGEAARRVRGYQALQAGRQVRLLREIEADLITTFDVGELMDRLAEGLPRLGIPSAYLALYEDPQPYVYPQPAPEWSRLLLAYDERGRIELGEGQRFRSRELVPEGILPGRQYSFVVEPFYFRQRQLGFGLFEVGSRDGTVYDVLRGDISSALQGALILRERERAEKALERAYAEVEQQVRERTAALEREVAERERLQQEVIEAQRRAIQELSTPIIPVLEGVIVMPLIGSVDTLRARDVTRNLLAGIREHKARVVILDITGVPIVDSGVAAHLNKTIQAARLKGARTIVTGVSEAVAETIVDLGIDWSGIETLSDLQSGLRAALQARVVPKMGWRAG